jgi:phage portal protein BeeE
MNGNENVPAYMAYGNLTAYKTNSIVFGAILARMSLFSEATFAFQDLETKKLSGMFTRDGRTNTSLRKLENPWPNGQTGDLLARMLQDADLAGNAYVWDSGSQLVRLRPDWITIISELGKDPLGREYRTVIGYFYDPPVSVVDIEGRPHFFTVDEVAHWAPIPDPEAKFKGMSWLTPVAREIAADQGMTSYKIKYLDNAASPNILVKYSQRLGDGTVNRIRDRMEARHSGVDNAFRTLVLDEGADVTIIGNSFEQMNFSTVQAAGENRILIASGVPGIVVGSKEGLMAATYSNYEQAMRRFADITMRPLWRSACAALAKLVTVPSASRLWYNTTEIAALRQGEKEMADTMLVHAQAAAALKAAGWKPDSIVEALSSGDITLLVFDEEAAKPPPLPTLPELPAFGTPPEEDTPPLNGSPKLIGANA